MLNIDFNVCIHIVNFIFIVGSIFALFELSIYINHFVRVSSLEENGFSMRDSPFLLSGLQVKEHPLLVNVFSVLLLFGILHFLGVSRIKYTEQGVTLDKTSTLEVSKFADMSNVVLLPFKGTKMDHDQVLLLVLSGKEVGSVGFVTDIETEVAHDWAEVNNNISQASVVLVGATNVINR